MFEFGKERRCICVATLTVKLIERFYAYACICCACVCVLTPELTNMRPNINVSRCCLIYTNIWSRPGKIKWGENIKACLLATVTTWNLFERDKYVGGLSAKASLCTFMWRNLILSSHAIKQTFAQPYLLLLLLLLHGVIVTQRVQWVAYWSEDYLKPSSQICIMRS